MRQKTPHSTLLLQQIKTMAILRTNLLIYNAIHQSRQARIPQVSMTP